MRALSFTVVLAACSSSSPQGPHVLLDFSRQHGFWDAPFPSDDLSDGTTVDVSGFPNPSNSPSVEQARALLAGNTGFSTTGGIFFQISEPLDPAGLPSIAETVAPGAPVFVATIDPNAPDYGVRYPLEVTFEATASPYGAPNLLALLPVQGMPLRLGSRYVAIVTTGVHTASGKPLEPAPRATIASFPDAQAALAELGLTAADVAGITAFTTGDPISSFELAHDAAFARPLPVIDAPFTLTDTFDDYCAYHTTIAMPDWQSGTPPYSSAGGTWVLDVNGEPVFDHSEESNLVLTVPRSAMPAAGYPLMVFIRTGAGGDRPLVDRGQQATNGGPPIVPGEGPALYLARAGMAAIEVDGPLGGLRNTTNANEDFTTFNVANLGAMRDNIRESALELEVIAHVGVALEVDVSDCPSSGGAATTFDAQHVALMGHSMGAWIAPLAAAFDPMFDVLVLSGAGGSWIDNIMWKKLPVAPLPVIETLLRDSPLAADDPVLTFAQWALEPADPQVYGVFVTRAPPEEPPRHVLMIQGIVDHYILPRIAEATSLSHDLDLAGPELDTEASPDLAGQLALGPLLPLDGRSALQLPVASNLTVAAGTATAVVTQHMADGIEDGHEVMFQTDVPKHEYQCMLQSWLTTGVPTVPTDAARDAPCP
jgi:pimeloyl-ACP methyl ester carboxylesterase